jgi:hypothetical protein
VQRLTNRRRGARYRQPSLPKGGDEVTNPAHMLKF